MGSGERPGHAGGAASAESIQALIAATAAANHKARQQKSKPDPHPNGATAASTDAITPEQILSADHEAGAYLRSLSTFTLHDLRLQPELLHSKASDLDRQLSDLCITQTDAFVSLHKAEQAFHPALDSLSQSLSHLISDSLPALQQAADNFARASAPSIDERQRIRNLIEQYEHGLLADLLDIPRLVDTCVRAHHYAEAIQLAEHLVKLSQEALQPHTSESQHSGPIPACRDGLVLVSLLHDAWVHLGRLKMDLISAFSRPGLDQSVAEKTSSTLRQLNRLGVSVAALAKLPQVLSVAELPDLRLDESQLCLCFLQARARLLDDALDRCGAPATITADVGPYLRHFISTWSEGISNTLSIAAVLFTDSKARSRPVPTPTFLVSAYANTALDRLRSMLETQLPQISQQNLQEAAGVHLALHQQLSRASADLARFGFDFALALNRSEHGSGLGLLDGAWFDTLSGFLQTQVDLCIKTVAQVPAVPSSWLANASLLSQPISNFSRPIPWQSKPNTEVTHFPPFAALLKSVLQALNALGTYAPVSLGAPLASQLSDGFARIAEILLTYAEQLENSDPHQLAIGDEQRKADELALLGRALHLFDSSVVSWSLDALQQGIFGFEQQTMPSALLDRARAWAQKAEAVREEHAKKEAQRVAKEEEKRIQREKVEKERKQREKDEAERKQREKEEAERKQKEKEEAERKQREQDEAKRKQREKEEAERKQKDEEEQRQREEQEAERKQREKEEAERKQQEKEEAERKERDKEEAERKQREEADAERKQKEEEEAERKLREKQEAERKQREDEQRQREKEAKEEEDRKRREREEEERRKREKEAKEAEERARQEEESRRKQEEEEAEQARLQRQQEKEEDEEVSRRKKEDEEAGKAAREEEEHKQARAQEEEQPKQPASSVKKTNLAEKLRLRKEQREREAAAAAAVAKAEDATPVKQEEQPEEPAKEESAVAEGDAEQDGDDEDEDEEGQANENEANGAMAAQDGAGGAGASGNKKKKKKKKKK